MERTSDKSQAIDRVNPQSGPLAAPSVRSSTLHTFIVRLCADPMQGGDQRWRASVDHLANGTHEGRRQFAHIGKFKTWLVGTIARITER